MNLNDYAFPRPMSLANGVILEGMEGLTKLELFAAMAMQSMCAGEGARQVADRDERYDGESGWAQIVASNAVQFADALIAELAYRQSGDRNY